MRRKKHIIGILLLLSLPVLLFNCTGDTSKSVVNEVEILKQQFKDLGCQSGTLLWQKKQLESEAAQLDLNKKADRLRYAKIQIMISAIKKERNIIGLNELNELHYQLMSRNFFMNDTVNAQRIEDGLFEVYYETESECSEDTITAGDLVDETVISKYSVLDPVVAGKEFAQLRDSFHTVLGDLDKLRQEVLRLKKYNKTERDERNKLHREAVDLMKQSTEIENKIRDIQVTQWLLFEDKKAYTKWMDAYKRAGGDTIG